MYLILGMNYQIEILSGRDFSARSKIEEILRLNKKEAQILEVMIKDIDANPSEDIEWWVSVNQSDELPNAMISVIFTDDGRSILRNFWAIPTSLSELIDVSKALLTEWIEASRGRAHELVADLHPKQLVTRSFLDFGFQVDKVLLTAYEAKTDYYDLAHADQLVFTKPSRQDSKFIYESLISPDLDSSSPIYISYEDFERVMEQITHQNDGSVLVKNEFGAIIGFGTSFLQGPEDSLLPRLYGPHAFDDEVLSDVIAEFLSYWKLKGYDKLRILRIQPFSEDILRKYKLKKLRSVSKSRYNLMIDHISPA